jgi:hypothetical protein
MAKLQPAAEKQRDGMAKRKIFIAQCLEKVVHFINASASDEAPWSMLMADVTGRNAPLETDIFEAVQKMLNDAGYIVAQQSAQAALVGGRGTTYELLVDYANRAACNVDSSTTHVVTDVK